MRHDIYRSGGRSDTSGRQYGISRGFRPGPDRVESPTGYDEWYLSRPPFREETPSGREAGEFSDHPRAYHGYLRSAEQRPAGAVGGARRVNDLMTVNPEAITPENTLAEAAEWMEALGVGLLPVVQDRTSRRLIGTLSERDIVVRGVARGKAPETPAAECMSRDLAAVNRNDDPLRARQVMRRWRLDRIPVTDRDGRLVGIIDDEDLPANLPRAGRQPRPEPGPPRRSFPSDTAHLHGGFVFGPTDRGGDVGFRPNGALGLDEW